jgi:ureidoglycolate hydrolase
VIPIEPLHPDAFHAFGTVLQSDREGFTSLFEQPDALGWQVGLNRVVEQTIPDMHYHPDTWECFAPLTVGLVLVVSPAAPQLPADRIRAFRVDAPVCVRPGTWHRLVCAYGPSATAFIAENRQVSGVLTRFDTPLRLDSGISERSKNEVG